MEMPVAAMMTLASGATTPMMNDGTSTMRARGDGRCARPDSGRRSENA
jgi:hypothetical protein